MVRSGFTLTEALVALDIVIMQRSLVQSRVATAQAGDRVAPEWLARSLLAEPLSELNMSLGRRSGVEAGIGLRSGERSSRTTGPAKGRIGYPTQPNGESGGNRCGCRARSKLALRPGWPFKLSCSEGSCWASRLRGRMRPPLRPSVTGWYR